MYSSLPTFPQKYPTEDIVRQSVPKRSYGIYGPHPLWRRLSGLTYAIEPHLPRKDRKRGLRRLSKWLEKNWQGKRQPKPTSDDGPKSPGAAAMSPSHTSLHSESQNPNPECAAVCPNGATSASPGLVRDSEPTLGVHDRVDAQPQRGCVNPSIAAPSASPAIRNSQSQIRPDADLSLAQDWNLSAKTWFCLKARGPSLEALCHHLQIRKAELTTLMREHCGLSADEVVDNLRLGKLQGALRDRVRTVAKSLWGTPKEMAMNKVCDIRDQQEANRRKRIQDTIARRLDGDPSREPCIYQTKEQRDQERRDRTELLIEALRKDFDAEMWSEKLGFASPARLKRACLRVLGRSLRNLERLVATEVTKYYLIAESRALRLLAQEKDRSEYTKIAQLLYWGEREIPKAPFTDEWSAYEFADNKWLEAMTKEFG